MKFDEYVERKLIHVRIVEVHSTCIINNGYIDLEEDVVEEEFSMAGIDTYYFECGICGETLQRENVEEHWRNEHND